MTSLMHTGSVCLAALVLVSAATADDQTATVTNDQASEPTSAEAVTELSVPPLDIVEYPDDRPGWLEEAPDLESNTHTWVVVTNPCESYEQSAEQLAILRRAAVSSYVQGLTQTADADFYPVNDKWIESQLIVKDYQGSLVQGDVPMFEQAVMLEFTPRTQEEILAAANNLQVRQRLGKLAALVSLGLVLLIGSSSLLGIVSRRVERGSAQIPAH